MVQMDARFPVPVDRLAAEVDALRRAPALKGLAGLLSRLPLGSGSQRRKALMARRGRDVEPAPAARPPRARRAAEPFASSPLEALYGAMPEGLVEVRAAAPERMPQRQAEALPAWVSGLESPGRFGRDEGETGAFLQLFARNVDSLSELSRTL
jgi:hypothetical protein